MPSTANMAYDFKLSDEHVRENPDGSLTVSGRASNFDVDRVGDVVTRRALERALVNYGRNPMLLYNHQYSQPAGLVTKALVDNEGLWIEATLPKPEAGLPRHYWDLVKRGVMRALSIGGTWKRELVNGVYALTDIDLREISIASVGVNAGTLLSVQTAKAFGEADGVDAITRLELAALRAEIADLSSWAVKAELRQLAGL